MDVRNSKNYVEIIKLKLEANLGQKGYQSHVAKAIGVHSSHFSQVLNGRAHLSLEQATALAEFWQFDFTLTEYFLDLVLFAKAGTDILRTHIQKRIDEIKPRLAAAYMLPNVEGPKKPDLSPEDEAFYWRNWYCGTIQACLSAPGLNSEEVMAERLGLKLSVIQSVLKRMEEMGLARRIGGSKWAHDDKAQVRGGNRDLTELFHASVRNKSAEKVMLDPGSRPLRSSVVGVVTAEDAAQIRKILEEAARQKVAIMTKEASGLEDTLVCYCTDFFQF